MAVTFDAGFIHVIASYIAKEGTVGHYGGACTAVIDTTAMAKTAMY